MSTYNDINSLIIYGRMKPKYGGNSARQFWDYPKRSDIINTAQNQYGGRRRKRRGCGLPPQYRNATPYQLGLTFPGGYTKSLNTFIGGRKRKYRRRHN